MSQAERTAASLRADLRSLRREPFTIALLVVMPIVSIQLFGLSLGSIANLGLFETGASLGTLGKVTGAVFATGALSGILGLFQSLGVQSADSRLVLAGYQRLELVAARFVTVLVTALLVALVTTASLAWAVGGEFESARVAIVGFFVSGVLYGLLGVLVGSVLPRALEGSLVLVALADLSAIVASGLFGIRDELAALFPLSHPHDIVLQAVVEGSLATAHVLPALGYLLAVVLLASWGYVRTLPARGGAA